MRYGLSMKQVCPLYRVQFKLGIVLAFPQQVLLFERDCESFSVN